MPPKNKRCAPCNCCRNTTTPTARSQKPSTFCAQAKSATLNVHSFASPTHSCSPVTDMPMQSTHGIKSSHSRNSNLGSAQRTKKNAMLRSEERRVGKECRSRWVAEHGDEKEKRVVKMEESR